MRNIEIESDELSPEKLGAEFNVSDWGDFVSYLRQKIKENPAISFRIVADWAGVDKAQQAKAIMENRKKLNIDSFTIRATREQMEEEVNVFSSGVEWEEI